MAIKMYRQTDKSLCIRSIVSYNSRVGWQKEGHMNYNDNTLKANIIPSMVNPLISMICAFRTQFSNKDKY